VGFNQGKVDTNMPWNIENHKVDKQLANHMDYKVFVANVNPGGKIFDPVVAEVDLVVVRVSLVDARVGFCCKGFPCC